jgi:hypothetical protein
MSTPLPFRQIHLDFHTGAAIPDVGRDFNAKEFALAMKRANVNSVTVFAKCHHGHLYYNTKRAERHPGLKKNLDLLGEQVEALHREGIRAPIYLSVQCDEYAANTNPEWIARNPDGSNVGQKPIQNPLPFFNWQILDMNSDYQEYLAEQTAEVLKVFKPVDGIFYDMCWDQPSVSHAAVRAMVKAGLNPESEDDRKLHAHRVALAYMKRFHQQVKAASKDASVYFNSRPLSNLAEEIPFLEQVEIEALPTGGWGYMYFPKNVRFARTFGKPYMGMTGRFHKSWGDFGGLKPYAALEYETAQMLAHGARCSIGDQLHPRGVPDRGTYDLIGKAYVRVAEREEWCVDAVPQVEIGLFQAPAQGGSSMAVSGTDEGATRLLSHLKLQFDVVNPTSDFAPYRVLILPDALPVTAPLAKRLAAFVKAGGSLLVSGTSGLGLEPGTVLLPELGVTPIESSPFQHAFQRFGDRINRDVPDSHHVCYERGFRVALAKGTESLGQWVEPYFERAWNHFNSHCQTPDATLTDYPIATLRRGKGKAGSVAYVSFPVFGAFSTHGNQPCKLLVRNILDILIPNPLVRIQAPSGAEVTVLRQAARSIVHVLYYSPERRTKDLDIIEDIVPLAHLPLSLAVAKAPKQVYLAPSREPLPFTWSNGRIELTIPEVRGHAMVVVE